MHIVHKEKHMDNSKNSQGKGQGKEKKDREKNIKQIGEGYTCPQCCDTRIAQ